MSASEIVSALEAGVITENEATEQGLVDNVHDLYERLARERDWHSSEPRQASYRNR